MNLKKEITPQSRSRQDQNAILHIVTRAVGDELENLAELQRVWRVVNLAEPSVKKRSTSLKIGRTSNSPVTLTSRLARVGDDG